jgi:hypothetical protein
MVGIALRDEILPLLPAALVTEDARQRFIELADSVDSIGRLDTTTHEPYVDGADLRRVLAAFLPSDCADRCMETLATMPDTRLIRPGDEVADRTLDVIGWKQLSEHAASGPQLKLFYGWLSSGSGRRSWSRRRVGSGRSSR